MLARAAQRFTDEPAIIDGTERLTFRQLQDQALAASAAFLAAGIAPQDRVGIWAPNSARWVVAALGILGCGAALVPLNTRLKGKEAGYILRRSGARALVTVDEFLGTRYPALLSGEALPTLERTVLLGDAAAAAAVSWREFL
ncbi:MAG TPA: AMP-binding protein, partial [Steroidobacteraceae bacterium]